MFQMIQLWLSGGENLCLSWTRSFFFIASSATVCKGREESTYKSSGLQIIRRVVDSGRKSGERKNKRKASEFNNPRKETSQQRASSETFRKTGGKPALQSSSVASIIRSQFDNPINSHMLIITWMF